ncbi:hypothetical protein HZB90_03380 [archaeon]|nr:hypothetical protein [archaeon]
MGMVEFDRFDCNIPLEFVTESDAYFLEKQGILPKPDDSGELSYQKLNVSAFPGILYSTRLVPFFGFHVPLYAQVLFEKPCAELKYCRRDWRDIYRMDELAMPQFLEDLEGFPLQPFYECLLRLRGVRIEQDHSQKEVGIARPGRVIFNGTLESRLSNFPWFVYTLLHELYHQVEFEMGEEVENYFCGNPRWTVERRCLFYDESKTHEYGCGRWWGERRRQARRVDLQEQGVRRDNSGNHAENRADIGQRRLFTHVSFYDLGWKDGDCAPFGHHLAEWLAVLTVIRHPEVVSRITPYYESVRARFFGRQLSLFPSLIWDA